MSIPLSIAAGGKAATALTAAVETAEVHECMGEPTTYRLRHAIVDQDGDFPDLSDATTGPGALLTLAGWVADRPEILVHGPIYAQDIHFQHGVSGSSMELAGSDESLVMDREVRAQVWGDGKVSAAVSAILDRNGFIPKVDPIEAQFVEADHALVQRDTDLRFLRRLARRYGRWFWLERTASDKTVAHFEAPRTKGTAAIELSINTKAQHVAELDLSWDVLRPTAGLARQLHLRDKQALAGDVAKSSLPPLGAKPFAEVAGKRTLHIAAPVDSAGDLSRRVDAALQEAGWFVRLRGKTSVRALGKLLRPYALVAVGGLGARHSGNYVVASVRHAIDAGGHAMEFELIRNAWEAA